MRSTIIAAAFVAGAIAVPFQKRDVVTDVDVVYVTDVVTVTAGETPSTSSATESTTAAVHNAAHYGHHSYHWSGVVSSSSTSEAVPVEYTSSTSSFEAAPTTSSTSEYVAPAPITTSTSEYVAPAPVTTSTSTYVAPSPTSTYVAPTSTSVYVAPVPTSTSKWVAPTTYAASSSSVASTADSTSKSQTTPTSYSDIVIWHHNVHRANHSAPDIAWSDDLANTAQDIAESCYYAHDTTANGGGYGQNIAAGTEPANVAAIITDEFYNGEVGWFDGLYGQANPDMTNFEHWGHFSQIVWKGTTHVGCYTQNCTSKGLTIPGSSSSDIAPYFTVCNYGAPGNYGGEYGDNIGESLNKPSVFA